MQPRVQISDLPAISHVAVGMLINKGTYGKVYEGTYEGRAVAIKTARKEDFDPTPEAFFLSKLRHPHVVDFIGIALIQKKIALVMRQEGKTLFSQIVNGISDKQRITYANDICSAFTYIHALEIIHGDIKTNNILTTSDDRLRLCDFGLSLLDTGDTDAKKRVARDRIDLGFVFHALKSDQMFLDNASCTTDELVTRIARLQITSSQDEGPISTARTICWKHTGDERATFINRLSTALHASKSIMSSSSTPRDPDALYKLGCSYEHGTEKDYECASRCYLEAAKQDHREAQYTVGMKYYEKFSGFFTHDSTQALFWLERAAEKDHINAQKKVASIFSSRDFGFYNPTKSLDWLKKAAEQGDLASCENVGLKYYFMEKFDEAEKWLQKSAANGWPTSAYYLQEIVKRQCQKPLEKPPEMINAPAKTPSQPSTITQTSTNIWTQKALERQQNAQNVPVSPSTGSTQTPASVQSMPAPSVPKQPQQPEEWIPVTKGRRRGRH